MFRFLGLASCSQTLQHSILTSFSHSRTIWSVGPVCSSFQCWDWGIMGRWTESRDDDVYYFILMYWWCDVRDGAIGMDIWAGTMRVLLSFVASFVGIHYVRGTTSIFTHRWLPCNAVIWFPSLGASSLHERPCRFSLAWSLEIRKRWS